MSQVVLEDTFDIDYEPEEEEIDSYLENVLNLTNSEDKAKFKSIAREALKAPLPKDWKPCHAEGEPDNIYYFNFKTGESTWDHPVDVYYKSLVDKKLKSKKSNSSSSLASISSVSSSILRNSSNIDNRENKKNSAVSISNVSFSVSNMSSLSSIPVENKPLSVLPADSKAETSSAAVLSALPNIPAKAGKIKLAPLAPLASLEHQTSLQLKKSASLNSLKRQGSTSNVLKLQEESKLKAASSDSMSTSSIAASFDLNSIPSSRASSQESLPLDRNAYTKQVLETLKQQPLKDNVSVSADGDLSSDQSDNYLENQRKIIKNIPQPTDAVPSKRASSANSAFENSSAGLHRDESFRSRNSSNASLAAQKLVPPIASAQLENNSLESAPEASNKELQNALGNSLEKNFTASALEVRDLYTAKLDDMQKRELDKYVEEVKALKQKYKLQLEEAQAEEDGKIATALANIKRESDAKLQKARDQGKLKAEQAELENQNQLKALQSEFDDSLAKAQTKLQFEKLQAEKAHKQEISALSNSHKAEIDALLQAQRAEVELLSNKHQIALKDMEQRLSEQSQKLQDKTSSFSAEVEKRIQSEVASRCESQINSLKKTLQDKAEFYETKITALEKELETRLAVKSASAENAANSERESLEIISKLKAELQSERETAKKQLVEYQTTSKEERQKFDTRIQELESLISDNNIRFAKLEQENLHLNTLIKQSETSARNESGQLPQPELVVTPDALQEHNVDLDQLEKELEQERKRVREINGKYQQKLQQILDSRPISRLASSQPRSLSASPAKSLNPSKFEELVEVQKLLDVSSKVSKANSAQQINSNNSASHSIFQEEQSDDSDSYAEDLKKNSTPSLVNLKKHLHKEEKHLKKTRQLLEKQKKVVEQQFERSNQAKAEWQEQIRSLTEDAHQVARLSETTRYFDKVEQQVDRNISALNLKRSQSPKLAIDTDLRSSDPDESLRFASLDEIDVEMSVLVRNLRSMTRQGAATDRFLQKYQPRSPTRAGTDRAYSYATLASRNASPTRENFLPHELSLDGQISSVLNPAVNISVASTDDGSKSNEPVFNSLMKTLYSPNGTNRRFLLERGQQRSATVLSNHRKWLDSFSNRKAALLGGAL